MNARNNFLEGILQQKRLEIDALLHMTTQAPDHPLNHVGQKKQRYSGCFAKALKEPALSVIAEVKRRSPALGTLGMIADPLALARSYLQGGAAAISVLTDTQGFGGRLQDLQEISSTFAGTPTLRKDFILHPIQIAEAKLAGAAAILLIVRLVGRSLSGLLVEAHQLGIEALVEVHDAQELDLALEAGANIIAVNHRDLETFETDLQLSDTLRPLIPPTVVSVAASGIHTPDHAKRMQDLGYDAILVGEALVKAKDPAQLIAEMREACHAH